MKKLRALAWLVAAGLFVMALALPATTMATKGTPHKVTICHATASMTNPYVRITVDQAAVDGVSGHGPADHLARHTGPVWDPSMTKHSTWGDIIPPFYSDGTADGLPSLNWTAAGQAIFYNDCKPAAQTTTTTSGTTTKATTQTTTQTTQTTSRATTSTVVSTTATGSVEGETGSATSTTATGSVEGQTGTAQATPPATDAMDAGTQSPAGSWSLLLLACAIAIVATLVLTPLTKSRRIK
jgi:hypothetical protein